MRRFKEPISSSLQIVVTQLKYKNVKQNSYTVFPSFSKTKRPWKYHIFDTDRKNRGYNDKTDVLRKITNDLLKTRILTSISVHLQPGYEQPSKSDPTTIMHWQTHNVDWNPLESSCKMQPSKHLNIQPCPNKVVIQYNTVLINVCCLLSTCIYRSTILHTTH